MEHEYTDEFESPTSSRNEDEQVSDNEEVFDETNEHSALPFARDHSYLPTSHPLFSEDLLLNSLSLQDNSEFSLPVLELPGVVLFPGCALPVRLHDRAWIDYLSRKIRTSREIPSVKNQVQFGVLARKEQPPPESWQRRQSWARHRYGPERLRRLSAQLIQELGDSISSSDEEEINESDGQEQQVQRNARIVQLRQARTVPNQEDRADDPHLGRVGTIATVTFTHGDLQRAGTGESQDELIVTALGTGRFRILGRVDDTSQMNRIQDYEGRIVAGIQYFTVQYLRDEAPTVPKLPLRLNFPLYDNHSPPRELRQNLLVQQLSILCPIYSSTLNMFWPWKLVETIKRSLLNTPSLSGVAKAMSETETHRNDPVRFSYWMVSNLPLEQSEKLSCLEMVSCVERLRFALEEVNYHKDAEIVLQCKTCRMCLSSCKDLFSVGGAEGTTGAYVNEHGYVHQTITVRDIDENEVMYSGGPETQNSWFAGYSWTIMNCGICFSHLGWKFQRVVGSREEDRPDHFFGLSAASIVTTTAPRRRRPVDHRGT